MIKLTPRRIIQAAMMMSRTTQVQLAKLVGVKGQSNISSAMARDMKVSRFVQYLDAMGYEVIVRERKRGRKTDEGGNAWLVVNEKSENEMAKQDLAGLLAKESQEL